MISRGDLDFLITYLHGELDHVNRAIAALERMARTRRAAAHVVRHPVDRAPVDRTGKGWTQHRRRAG